MPKREDPPWGTPTPSQTNSDAFWRAAELGTGLIELDRSECLELLAAKSVGRLAYVVDNGARILPLNYVVAEDCSFSVQCLTVRSFTMRSVPYVLSRSTRPTSSSSQVGASWQSGTQTWPPKRTSLECGMGSYLSRGPEVTDTCSYDCPWSISPDVQ